MTTEKTIVSLEIVGNPVTTEMVDGLNELAADIEATMLPAESIIDRLRISEFSSRHRCVGYTKDELHPGRLFDVTGIPICETCIRDIAPVVAALAQALEEEE